MEKDNSDKKDRLSLWIGGSTLLVLGSYVLGWWAMNHWIRTPTERGQFGDMFGSLNALFSALALIALIYTVLLQRKDLALQREELRLSIEELKRSATAQEQSRGELQRQAAIQMKAARIQALSTLVEHYTGRLGSLNDKESFVMHTNKAPLLAERDISLKALKEELETAIPELRTD